MNQFGLFPGNIVIGRAQELALGISNPFLGKECDRIFPGNFWRRLLWLAGEGSIESRRNVAASAKGQVSNLSCPRINLDEVSVASLLFQHEIESVDAREMQPSDHFFRGRRHLRVFDQ